MSDNSKKLKQILDELVAEGADNIVANPDTIQKLQKQGVPIKERFIPYNEYLDELIKKKSKEALSRLGQLPKIDKTIADGVIAEIYEEIRSSYALGFFTSTIINSILLLEYSMRASLYNERIKHDPNFSWSNLEKKQMGKLIELLYKAKLISNEEKKQLKDFSENMRNLYLHINIQKMSEGIIISKIPGLKVDTQEKIELKDVKASEHKFLWFAAKRFFDKYHVQPTIDFCIDWTNQLLSSNKPDGDSAT